MTLRVVIAEDNKVYREGVRAVLEFGGEFEVVAAVDTPEALLADVDERRPDAVITDIRMPPTHHMEGIEAAHEIRRRHPSIGILVLSQHADDSYAFELLKAHLTEHHLVPPTAQEMKTPGIAKTRS